MGKPYADELQQFSATYLWAENQNVDELGLFLSRWKGDHVAVVGSGGSFSAALVASLFREIAHHSATTPVTPHEFTGVCKRLMSRSLLLTAEGKNKDILHAARTARSGDLPTAALTLTAESPLTSFSKETSALRVFSYQADWVKDGYLATNSLLATVLLLYRALFNDHSFKESISPLFEPTRLATRRHDLLSLFGDSNDLRQRSVLLLHSSQAKAFAVDLESKLSEAAITFTQVCDLRQFAHGRHLQLALRNPTPFVILACSAEERALAIATKDLLPSHVHSRLVEIEGHGEQNLAISGLIDAMYVTEALSIGVGHDPGNPTVMEFGRAIHGLDPEALTLPSAEAACVLTAAAKRKSASHGNHPPIMVLEASKAYAARLAHARFKGIVCDFDGTLCRTENRFGKMDRVHAGEIDSLLRQGLKIAIATGRGDSVQEILRQAFSPEFHSSIVVGYYNGSYITTLDQPFSQPEANPKFEELWNWLANSALQLPNKSWKELARGGHLSLRLGNIRQCRTLRDRINVWIDQTGRQDWRVFCSGHSVDVLDGSTSKRHVVQRFADIFSFDAQTEILRIGDCGQEDGNDFELLGEGLSLSCDSVSADLDTCWNFGALGSNQSEVTMTYLRALTPVDGTFKLSPSTLPFLNTAADVA